MLNVIMINVSFFDLVRLKWRGGWGKYVCIVDGMLCWIMVIVFEILVDGWDEFNSRVYVGVIDKFYKVIVYGIVVFGWELG